MPYFSVIMPIYNGEKYIERAVKSILNQTFCDFELIMIDDGSNDNSMNICRNLIKKDNRLRFIHQNNQGALMARKTGVDIARGTYILFIDCDDTFKFDALAKIYDMIIKMKVDIILFNYYFIKRTNCIIPGKKILSNKKIYSGKELFLLSIKYFGLLNSLCIKAVKASIIKSAFSVYQCNISMAEDLLISLRIFKYSNSAAYLDEYLYNYIDNQYSSMHNVKEKYFSEYEFVYLEAIKLVEEYHFSNKIKKIITKNFLIKIMADYFFYTFQRSLTFGEFMCVGEMLFKKAYMKVRFDGLSLGIIWNIPYKIYLARDYHLLYLYFLCLKCGYLIKNKILI